MTKSKKFFMMAAVVTALGVLPTGKLSAQTSGVGSDGYTRFMWNETNGAISIWRLDPNLANYVLHIYGPYDGWVPMALTVGSNNHSYVMWKHTNGSISLWDVDANLNFVTNHIYGPYYGWIPESLAVSEDGFNRLRVIWRETSGEVAVWALDSNLNFLHSAYYGPYIGWEPSAGTDAIKKPISATQDLKRLSDPEGDAKASAAMANPATSKPNGQ